MSYISVATENNPTRWIQKPDLHGWEETPVCDNKERLFVSEFQACGFQSHYTAYSVSLLIDF